MQNRMDWSNALAERFSGAMQLSRAFAENRDDISNYNVAERKEMGDLFAVASGVVLLCRTTAAAREYHPATVRLYDGLFSVFSRYAFKSMLMSGSYGSMDEIQEWCHKLTTGIAERFQHFDVDPFKIFDAATTLQLQQHKKRVVRIVSGHLRDFLSLFRQKHATQ